MTTERPESFVIALTDLCSRYGVAVVFVPELPKLRTSGVCRWLGPEKALIQLSLRYKTADQLWFTFFHEAGHVLLHQRKKSIYLDERCPSEFNEEEEQANAFAAGILIPESDLKSFLESNPNPRLADIESFAMDIGVAPGIVVGRLQHDGILDFRVGNGLKMRLQWEEPA